MKKLLIFVALAAFTLTSFAQKRHIDAHWCALGTSITWYNENASTSNGGFKRGYQSRVMDKLQFSKYSNKAVNGGALKTALNQVITADYYTIEHGVNDWGQGIPVGTLDDYINNKNNGTFAAEYRKLIDKIFELNKKAKVVLCTQRKAYGFSGYLPDNCNSPKNGIYAHEYADMVKKIAAYEGFPVADFFYQCGGQRDLLGQSLNNARANIGYYNDAVHPNDIGFQRMADVLIDALEKVLVD